jgi:hypothetical protein
LELMWYGLRPAFVADSVDNIAVQAGFSPASSWARSHRRWSAPDRAA